MKRELTIAIVLLTVLLVIAGLLIMGSQAPGNTPSGGEQPTQNYTSVSNGTTFFSSYFTHLTNSGTVCIVPVEGNGVYLRVASDSTNQSLGGVRVFAVPRADSCFGDSIPEPFETSSNASGWVSLGLPNVQANYYYQTTVLNFGGRNYSFSLPQGPLETTLANLYVPSGNLSVQLCQTEYGPMRLLCHPFVNGTDTSTPTTSSSVTHG